MSFWEFIIFVIIPSGIVGGIVSGLVTYFSNKRLDSYKRTMEERKRVYSEVNELLSKFFTTESDEESNKAGEQLLKYYREIQIWGSDEVVRSFTNYNDACDAKSKISQDERDNIYKNFVITMRKDIIGRTDLAPEEIIIRGFIRKQDTPKDLK